MIEEKRMSLMPGGGGQTLGLFTRLFKGMFHVFVYVAGHPDNRALKAWNTRNGLSLKSMVPRNSESA